MGKEAYFLMYDFKPYISLSIIYCWLLLFSLALPPKGRKRAEKGKD
tara:strand:+ start:546 stop:683 length:138 start_codon:yes stop_codon:yes gene_type:complete